MRTAYILCIIGCITLPAYATPMQKCDIHEQKQQSERAVFSSLDNYSTTRTGVQLISSIAMGYITYQWLSPYIGSQFLTFMTATPAARLTWKALNRGLPSLDRYMRNRFHEETIFQAAENGDALDEKSITVENVNSYEVETGRSLLQAAIRGNNQFMVYGPPLDNVRILLQRGANPNAGLQYIRKMLSSWYEHDDAILRMLLTHGALCSATDNNGNTIYNDLLDQHMSPNIKRRILRTLLTYDRDVCRHPLFTEIVNQAEIPTDQHDIQRLKYDITRGNYSARTAELEDHKQAEILLHAYIMHDLYSDDDHLRDTIQQLQEHINQNENAQNKFKQCVRNQAERGEISLRTYARICREYGRKEEMRPDIPDRQGSEIPFVLINNMYNSNVPGLQQEAIQTASQRLSDGTLTPFEARCLFEACPERAAAYRDENGNSPLYYCEARPQYQPILLEIVNSSP